VTARFNEWRNEQWSTTLESLNPEDHSLLRMTKRVMRIPTPSPPWSPQGVSFYPMRRQKPLQIVWRLFRPVTVPSATAVIETVNAELDS
jgi:hypothetical protein